MATKQKKPALGRGLDAILIDNDEQKEQNGVCVVRLSEVEPNPEQPRKAFENEPLESLAESIAQHGIIQPIVVRRRKESGKSRNSVYQSLTEFERFRWF